MSEVQTVMIAADELSTEKKTQRPSSAGFKVMPETRQLRDQIRTLAGQFMQKVDRGRALTRPVLQEMDERRIEDQPKNDF